MRAATYRPGAHASGIFPGERGVAEAASVRQHEGCSISVAASLTYGKQFSVRS
jgi:hypothetical protein